MHDCCSTTDEGVDVPNKSGRTGMLAAGGSVLSALGASACCWIPLLLIAFGASAGGVSAWFEGYRWLFLGVSAVLLATGFYFVYFRRSRCAPESTCAAPGRGARRFSRITLWVATVVVIATAAFPRYAGSLMPKSPAAQAGGPIGERTTVSLAIDGMTCEACGVILRNTLVNVAGVLDASVSYSDGTAAISFDPSAPPSETDLASAVARAGYKADTSAMIRKDPP